MSVCIALIFMTITEVAELVTNSWRSCTGGSIDHHRGHGSPHPGRRSLDTAGGGRGPRTDRAHHISVRLPGLGDRAPERLSDLVAEVARGHVKRTPIHLTLIIRSLTGKRWLMPRVWHQSCGNGECGWR